MVKGLFWGWLGIGHGCGMVCDRGRQGRGVMEGGMRKREQWREGERWKGEVVWHKYILVKMYLDLQVNNIYNMNICSDF